MKTCRCCTVFSPADVSVVGVNSVVECWQWAARLWWCCRVMMPCGRGICRLTLIETHCSISMRNTWLIGAVVHIRCIQWKLLVLLVFYRITAFECSVISVQTEICYKWVLALPYILTYKPTIFGWILMKKLWGSAYIRCVPHRHILTARVSTTWTISRHMWQCVGACAAGGSTIHMLLLQLHSS